MLLLKKNKVKKDFIKNKKFLIVVFRMEATTLDYIVLFTCILDFLSTVALALLAGHCKSECCRSLVSFEHNSTPPREITATCAHQQPLSTPTHTPEVVLGEKYLSARRSGPV